MATLSIPVASPSTGKMEHVALSRLQPSTTNPRKVFAETGLAELAASIRERGILQPILVRVLPACLARIEQEDGGDVWTVYLGPGRSVLQRFDFLNTSEENAAAAQEFAENYNHREAFLEIVAGERRWRAAGLAECETVPVIITKLSDEEAMELQVIENLQREDVHPLEEAEGYRALKKAAAIVAQRVGKPLPYVVERLALLQLTALSRLLYSSGNIELAHAITLAKLTDADQLRAVKSLMGWNNLPAKTDWIEALKSSIKRHQGSEWRMVRDTPAQLDKWVRDHVLLVLKNAPWLLGDAALVPEAGACTSCVKRTGNNMALFGNLTIGEETCTDGACFELKRKAYIAASLQLAQDKGAELVKLSNVSGHKVYSGSKPYRNGQWVKSKKGACKGTKQGIFIDEPSRWNGGNAAGSKLYVCVDQGCKTHKHTVETDAPKQSPQQQQVDEAKQEAALAVERDVRRAVIDAIRIPALQNDGCLREILFNSVAHSFQYAMEVLGIDGDPAPDEDDYEVREKWEEEQQEKLWQWIKAASVEDLNRVAFVGRTRHLLTFNDWQFNRGQKKQLRESLWAMAERYGVNADAIAQRLETQHKQQAADAKKAAKKGGK